MKVLIFLAFCLALACATTWDQLDNYSFRNYIIEHKKFYTTEEFPLRKLIFEENLQKIKLHNSDPTKSWKNGVNQFTDRTREERERLLGLSKQILTPADVSQFDPSILTLIPNAPASIDWRSAGIITSVKDQGGCGSCWTFATAESVESYWANKTGMLAVLSEQQILDCTPNPNQCGGTGGCGGGTAEIAFTQIVAMGGLASEWTYPYISYSGSNYQCHFNANTPPVAQIQGYMKLPSNVYAPLFNAIATKGPIAISVDASDWFEYESGVFDGCNQTNPDIDHAVQLVGYGTDSASGLDYWLVRNSWSPTWGEQGYIRLLRTPTKLRCGTDLRPSDGTGCKNGPKTVTVCGTCGILYDNTYPIV